MTVGHYPGWNRQKAIRPPNKARPVYIDGYKLDSQAEAKRYGQLRLQQGAGQIVGEIEVHPVYEIEINGFRVGRYTVDFRYRTAEGVLVVEDVKGGPKSDPNMRYLRFKAKCVYALYGHTVTFVQP